MIPFYSNYVSIGFSAKSDRLLGRIYCTGPGGTWVFAPDGSRIGIIRTPEIPAE